MNIFPAIDLYDKKAVRLVKGDYNQMTIYSNNPLDVAKSFYNDGAQYLHIVDLEGARDGSTANFNVIADIVKNSGLKVEVGGGIRDEAVIKKYIDAGVMRVILGTAAITRSDFLEEMVEKYKDKIAVGVDIKGENVAIKGWTEVSEIKCFDFCKRLCKIGVKTIICTDISKDGLLAGTNLELYKQLSERFSIDIVASGGITTLDDVERLSDMNIYGAILGKALYTGKINLSEAVRVK